MNPLGNHALFFIPGGIERPCGMPLHDQRSGNNVKGKGIERAVDYVFIKNYPHLDADLYDDTIGVAANGAGMGNPVCL